MNDTGDSVRHGDPEGAGWTGRLWLKPPPWCDAPRHTGSLGSGPPDSQHCGNLWPEFKLFVYCDDMVAREVYR